MEFEWKIPKLSNSAEQQIVNISTGSVHYIVSANGSGKSALITHLTKTSNNVALVRISAHRQSYFNSNSIDITQKIRNDTQRNILSLDRQDFARWKDDYATQRSQIALFDLANSESASARTFKELHKKGEIEAAEKELSKLSPIEEINNILMVSSLSCQISINESGDLLAQHGNGAQKFSITELSDGERNAVMLAAQVLTAKPDTLLVIDEPERHLHRSITEPLLAALFNKRSDCAFVIATHEPELPTNNPKAGVIIVRKCSWNGKIASGWDIDLLPADSEIPEEVRKAILGTRRNLLFIEGEKQSLDYSLYSALFSNLSIKSVGSCSEVIRIVKGLKETTQAHWLKPMGLIDSDDRTSKEIAELEEQGVYALDASSVESLFYSKTSIEAIATLQAYALGDDAQKLMDESIAQGLRELDEGTQEDIAARRCEKTARNNAMRELPNWRAIKDNEGIDVFVEVKTTYKKELVTLQEAIKSNDVDKIVNRYSIKKTHFPSTISKKMKYQKHQDFEMAVVVHAKRNQKFRDELKSKLGNLPSYLDTLTS